MRIESFYDIFLKMADYPSYLKLYESGELKKRISSAFKLLKSCSLCPRGCGVNRLKDEQGFCKSGLLPVVSSDNAHFGEEPPISGSMGSGTIFLTHCNLRCVFCQNYPISQLGRGEEVSFKRLAEMMLSLQRKGCHNINFVTPTHFVPQILKSLRVAVEGGLNIPLVYNSGGYDRVETLRLLEGIFDIYMPDAKYQDEEAAEKFSNAPDYPRVNEEALKEMYRQVGPLIMNEEGIAKRGLIVRHLFLPDGISNSSKVLKMVSLKVGKDIYLSLMAQYFPAHKAYQYPEINRRIRAKEYKEALGIMREVGLERGYCQQLW